MLTNQLEAPYRPEEHPEDIAHLTDILRRKYRGDSNGSRNVIRCDCPNCGKHTCEYDHNKGVFRCHHPLCEKGGGTLALARLLGEKLPSSRYDASATRVTNLTKGRTHALSEVSSLPLAPLPAFEPTSSPKALNTFGGGKKPPPWITRSNLMSMAENVHEYELNDRDRLYVAILGRDDGNGKKVVRQYIQRAESKNLALGRTEQVKPRSGWPLYPTNLRPTETAVLVEGESNADAVNRALGSEEIVAFSTLGGAGKVKSGGHTDFSTLTSCLEVVIIPDYDHPGYCHAADLAKRCFEAGVKAIRVVDWTDLDTPLPKGYDAKDFLEDPNNSSELLRLIGKARSVQFDRAPVSTPSVTLAPAECESTAIPFCEPGTYGYYEADVSLRLVELHGQKMRYCEPWGKWLIWNGKIWELDQCGKAHVLAEEAIRSLLSEAANTQNDDARGRLLSLAKKLLTATGVNNVLRLTQSKLPILPNEFDADPLLLNTQNGTVDLSSGKLAPHAPDKLMMHITNADYIPGVRHADSEAARLFQRVLDEVTGGDTEYQRFLAQVAGLIIRGDNIGDHLVIAYGPGGTGKGTFLGGLAKMLGSYAAEVRSSALSLRGFPSTNNDDLAALTGVRMARVEETAQHQLLDAGEIKRLTSGETIKVAAKYQRAFDLHPRFTICMLTNVQPEVPPDDSGMWRRVKMLPFVHKPAVVDFGLRDALREQCLPHFLDWAIAGHLDYLESGLVTCPVVEDATKEYRRRMDPFALWVEDRVCLDADSWTSTDDLFRDYRSWQSAHGTPSPYHPDSPAILGLQIQKRATALGIAKKRCTIDGSKRSGWSGITLKDAR